MPSGPSQTLREHFEALVDLDPAARAARLAGLDLDEAQRSALHALLSGEERVPRILELPLGAVLDAWQDLDLLADGYLGREVGPFRTSAVLGQGGSAVVFRAERAAGDSTQVVALKVLRSGLHAPEAQRRFAREQAILAQLSHPHIARLIEGGVSHDGLPYIAMELVDGEPITRHADRQALGLDARLGLMRTLCRAVEAAHAALVVHRDLKPSNVLVAGDGEVKVLDFGIAKLLDGEIAQAATQAIMLTPEYAAPEQFRPGPVSTAADVYALGVLLGELLTGQLLGSRSTSRASDIVRRGRGDKPRGLPERDSLARRLRGDLDAIVATAIAEEPSRRYRSAGALADDLDRFLARRPVHAHPPTGWYRMRKFVQRHRGGVVLTLLMAIATLGALAVALQQAAIARRAASTAQAEAARATTMRDVMFDAFAQAQPGLPGASETTVVDVVERALASARTDRSADPRARIELLSRLAQVLGARGQLARSDEILAELRASAARELPADDPLQTELVLATVFNLVERGDHAAARARIEPLLRDGSTLGADLRLAVLVESSAIALNQRDFARAIDEATTAVRLARALARTDLLAKALRAQGSALSNAGQPEQAVAVQAEVVQLLRARHGDTHAAVASAEDALARSYRRAGDLDAAERHARAAIAVDTATLPGDHARRGTHLNGLAMILFERRAYDEQLAVLRDIVGIAGYRDADPANLAANLGSIAITQAALGDLAAAEASARQALAVLAQDGRQDELLGLRIRMQLGRIVALRGRREEGDALLAQMLAGLGAVPAPSGDLIGTALEYRVRVALDAGDPTVARERIAPYLAHAQDMQAQPAWAGRAETLRAELLLDLGDVASARQALAVAQQQLDAGRHTEPTVKVAHALVSCIAWRSENAGAAPCASARTELASLRFPPPHIRALAERAFGATP